MSDTIAGSGVILLPRCVSRDLAAKKHLDSFIGRVGNFSVLRRPSSNTQVSVHTSVRDSVSVASSLVSTTSETSDVANDAPSVEIEVAPVVSSTGRVLRQPVLYKDTRR
jgi:hypothetical protein